jgi:hypothetical protein
MSEGVTVADAPISPVGREAGAESRLLTRPRRLEYQEAAQQLTAEQPPDAIAQIEPSASSQMPRSAAH